MSSRGRKRWGWSKRSILKHFATGQKATKYQQVRCLRLLGGGKDSECLMGTTQFHLAPRGVGGEKRKTSQNSKKKGIKMLNRGAKRRKWQDSGGHFPSTLKV